MGCASSLPEGNPEEKARNRRIEMELKTYKKDYANRVKLLLLGAGESGKSTVFKQLKLLYGTGFSDSERVQYRDVVYANTLSSMKKILFAVEKMEIPLQPENVERAEIIKGISDAQLLERPSAFFTIEMAEHLHALWNDSGVQAAYKRRNEYQLNDSADYYLNDVARLAQANYVPTVQDVLRSRVKTSGITEDTFEMDGKQVTVVDVGGQRTERRKWIHCFSEVTAILFVTSLSEYDQTLEEDETVNRMRESLHLFEQICNSEYFQNTPVILFLNKKDLLQEKISRVSLGTCFPDYLGGSNVDNALKFIQSKFESLNRNPETKKIYTKPTTATDETIMRDVFRYVEEIITDLNFASLE